MKVKITLLTGVVLFVILCVFDVFIFFTLSAHLRTITLADAESRAQSIAQYALNRVNDNNGSTALNHDNASQWMTKFLRADESAYLIGLNGQLIADVGELHVPYPSISTVTDTKAGVRPILLNGATYYLAAAPIFDEDKKKSLGNIVLLQQPVNQSQYMHELRLLLLFGSFGAICLTIAGSYLVSLTSTRPLRRMVHDVGDIEASRLERRMVVPTTHDEVEQLARAFNRMLERIERSWNQQSRFVADASHEIRTPLAVIQGYANLLDRWGKSNPEVLNEAIDMIRAESTRLQALTTDLLMLARAEATGQEEIEISDVHNVLQQALGMVKPIYPNVVIDSEVVHQAVTFPQAQLKRVLINLLDNACKYCDTNARIHITTVVGAERVAITISDNGLGIPEEDIPHLFERFYRVDKSRQRGAGGTGLGLALVKELVESHHGTVYVKSQLGQGTRVVVEIPKAL